MDYRSKNLVKEFKIVFWDFDGVIKDSVSVKSLGYAKLFSPFGQEVVEQVNQHHEVNGGVSRFEKIPLYLSWAGEQANPAQVHEFCNRFSNLVQQAVIDSPWVPGVYEYLKTHYTRQCFILITGTPQEEIEQILDALELTRYFKEVHGAPKIKANVVSEILTQMDYSPEQALVIGDSNTDLEAAKRNNVAFLLRCSPHNHSLQEKYSGSRFKNLKNE